MSSTQQGIAAWFDRTYRRRGARYLRPPAAYPIFLQLLEARGGAELLDIACGAGLLLEAARARGLRAVGVDLSREGLALARQRVPDAPLVCANAEHLPFPDRSFDFVTCLASLERFLDRERALAEMLRVARADARLCIMVRNASAPGWRVWRQWFGRRERQAHQDAATLEQWTELLERCGLRIESVHADQWPRQRLRRWLRAGRRGGEAGPEPIARPLLGLRASYELVFVLRRGVAARHRDVATARLYEGLARCQWLRRGIAFAGPGRRLAMHKTLAGPDGGVGPPAGSEGLGGWLVEWADPPRGARVLDVGCGFGATLFPFARRAASRCVGLTSSRFQADKAAHQARRLALDDRCTFVVQDLRAPIDGVFDVIVAVETLLHVGDVAAAIAHLARHLAPGGRVVLVEDMALDERIVERPDARELCARWRLSRIPNTSDYERGLADAGLRVRASVDLTGRVVTAPPERRACAARWLRRLGAVAAGTRWADTADAFLGGFALERLHRAGQLRYRALLAERTGGGA